MLYPENIAWIAQIKTWISASLARTLTFNQRQLITVDEVLNPCYNDPWDYNVVNYAISTVDGYIMVKFPADGVYTPIVDRYPMAVEATEELMRYFETISFETDQTTELMRTHVQKLFSWLYAWNTELVWIDKVHPEDICAKILFNTPALTYNARAALVGGLSPDFFLRGKDYYAVETWLNNTSRWTAMDTAQFLLGSGSTENDTFYLYYPGQGYSYGQERTAFEMQSQARGLSYALLGVLAKGLTDKTRLTSESWPKKLSILTDAAVYCNPMMSYLIRLNF